MLVNLCAVLYCYTFSLYLYSSVNFVLPMTDVFRFYSFAHIIISFAGAMLLLAIWFNINDRFKQTLFETNQPSQLDKGLLFLSLSIFVWVVAGCWNYFGHRYETTKSDLYLHTGNNIFSIINDFFLFLALRYADHAPAFIYRNKANSRWIILLIFLAIILTLLIPMMMTGADKTSIFLFIAVPDILLSAFLTILLIITFYRTFSNRGLKIAGVISVIAILFIFASILPDVFHNMYDDFTRDLIKITAKSSFIAVTLVMATSWVIELAHTPNPSEMTIDFQDWSLVKINIPSKRVTNARVDFGSKTTQYANLLKFAIRRKFADDRDQSIGIGFGCEINNQTYLTRIIENINEILSLQDEQKLDRKDLFTFIGQGKYRFRIVPENIKIDAALLREFINTADNETYKRIVADIKN